MTLDAGLPDYRISSPDMPVDYPSTAAPDTYTTMPVDSTYDQRRQEFVDFVLHNPAPENAKPVWYELIRLSAGRQAHTGIIEAALDYVDDRRDCADFVLHSILRMLYQFTPAGKSSGVEQLGEIHPALHARANQTVPRFQIFPG